MVQGSVDVPKLLERMQAHAFTHRLRFQEYFQDYDKLRSGLISEAQFKQGLSLTKQRISPAEFDALADAFRKPNDTVKPGRCQWRVFCDTIDEVFTTKNMEKDPHTKVGKVDHVIPAKTWIFRHPDDVQYNIHNDHQRLGEVNQLLESIELVIRTRRQLIEPFFQDFDKLRHGKVTRQQFNQVLDRLNIGLSEYDCQLLTEYYTCQKTTSAKLVNYLQFTQDVTPKATAELTGHDIHDRTGLVRIRQDKPAPAPVIIDGIDVDAVEDYIRTVALKNRIRLIEFFRDFDKLRCGYVTEEQFHIGLGFCKFFDRLSLAEVKALMQKYRHPNDNVHPARIGYRDFCESIDKIFTTKGLEKDPRAHVPRPTVLDEYHLSTTSLPADEEEIVQQVLNQFRQIVKVRRTLVKPFFQDFDHNIGNPNLAGRVGHVTKSQFRQILGNLFPMLPVCSPVWDEDMKVLWKKYNDTHTDGDLINYIAFAEDIDKGAFAEGQDTDTGGLISNKARDAAAAYRTQQRNETAGYFETHLNANRPLARGVDGVSVPELMDRIRSLAFTQRIRVHEFFRDFDKLRTGHVPIEKFRIGLTMCKVFMSDAEYDALARVYKNDKYKDHVNWLKFADDVDSIFTKKSLEKSPLEQVPAMGTQVVPTHSIKAQPTNEEMLHGLLLAIQERVQTRRILLQPFFQDFDKLHSGRVSKNQFAQGLAYLQLDLTDADRELLYDTYCDTATGDMNYLQFNRDIDAADTETYGSLHPQQTAQNSTKIRDGAAMYRTKMRNVEYSSGDKTVDDGIVKVQEVVKKRRIRLRDMFLDYDKLRKGHVITAKFRTVLDGLNLQLPLEHRTAMEEYWRVKEMPDRVWYTEFCDVVDSVFTEKGLERSPTKHVQLRDFRDNDNVLDTGGDEYLHELMSSLGYKVQICRVLIKPYFQDYDRVHRGRVTKNQFTSVMAYVNLQISDVDADVIFNRYKDSRNDFNYPKFCEALETWPINVVH